MKICKVTILLFFLLSAVYAQNASTREWTIFQKGIAEYQKGNYEMARQSFSLMLNKLPGSALTTANYLMLAKTNYKSGDYTVSLEQCESFKKNYPHSAYIDDINYLMANNYYRLNRLETAVVTWLKVGFATSDNTLKEKALTLADDVMRYKTNRASIQSMSEQYFGSPIDEAFRFHLAYEAYRNGNKSYAINELKNLKGNVKTEYYGNKVNRLLDLSEGKSQNEINIAALLPITGANQSVGIALLDGLNMAAEEFNKKASVKVKITPYDYASKLIEALQMIKKISSDESYVAVFGPVENDIAAACAAVADYEGITIVSPTASDNNIQKISQNCVTLAPTVSTMARVIQNYAYDSLKVQRVATFTPLDDYYIKMTEEFVADQEANDGLVAAQEWYYPGDQDFKKQFRKLKRIGLKLEFSDSVSQVYPDIKKQQVDSLYKIYMTEQRELLKETKTKLDSADLEINAFDGMFVPVFADDISFMASQIAYANFKTQLLGNSDWYDKDALKKNRNYINGIIFVTDGYLNEESWDYRQFKNNFRNNLKKTPDNFALISYDCFNFVSGIFNGKSVITRQNFLENLVQLRPYQGIYRNFTIDNSRTNKSARLLKYIYGQIIPV
ncbi:MAG: penicillin-binding protein activator, partial [Calditrichaeota bacterium]|nr:penicillin-binding protein activator [Calditrichota bacterium]